MVDINFNSINWNDYKPWGSVLTIGIPFDKFLQMSDAEIEYELQSMFATTDPEIQAKSESINFLSSTNEAPL